MVILTIRLRSEGSGGRITPGSPDSRTPKAKPDRIPRWNNHAGRTCPFYPLPNGGSFDEGNDFFLSGIPLVCYKGQTPPNTVFWACVQIAFVIAALLAWGPRHYKWRALVTGRPELLIPPQGCYVDERRFTFTDTAHPEAQNSWVETTTIQAMASCLLLRITNDPKMPVDQANAKGIGAVITILNDIGKELFSFDARWADTSQPFTRQTGQSRFDLLSVDIPIGKTREVDIAFKFQPEDLPMVLIMIATIILNYRIRREDYRRGDTSRESGYAVRLWINDGIYRFSIME